MDEVLDDPLADVLDEDEDDGVGEEDEVVDDPAPLLDDVDPDVEPVLPFDPDERASLR